MIVVSTAVANETPSPEYSNLLLRPDPPGLCRTIGCYDTHIMDSCLPIPCPQSSLTVSPTNGLVHRGIWIRSFSGSTSSMQAGSTPFLPRAAAKGIDGDGDFGSFPAVWIRKQAQFVGIRNRAAAGRRMARDSDASRFEAASVGRDRRRRRLAANESRDGDLGL